VRHDEEEKQDKDDNHYDGNDPAGRTIVRAILIVWGHKEFRLMVIVAIVADEP
jgi:hypothetical protein